MLKLSELKAIDIHTHAEEPCGTHADDGYDDFQAGMHAYFKSSFKHPPTIPETSTGVMSAQASMVAVEPEASA